MKPNVASNTQNNCTMPQAETRGRCWCGFPTQDRFVRAVSSNDSINKGFLRLLISPPAIVAADLIFKISKSATTDTFAPHQFCF
jgi:hypothetical protein